MLPQYQFILKWKQFFQNLTMFLVWLCSLKINCILGATRSQTRLMYLPFHRKVRIATFRLRLRRLSFAKAIENNGLLLSGRHCASQPFENVPRASAFIWTFGFQIIFLSASVLWKRWAAGDYPMLPFETLSFPSVCPFGLVLGLADVLCLLWLKWKGTWKGGLSSKLQNSVNSPLSSTAQTKLNPWLLQCLTPQERLGANVPSFLWKLGNHKS